MSLRDNTIHTLVSGVPRSILYDNTRRPWQDTG